MTTRIYPPLYLAASATGIWCTASEAWSNVDYIAKQVPSLLDPAVACVVAMSAGVVIALSCAIEAFRNRHVFVGSCLFLAFAGGVGFTVSTTLDRVASTRDASLAKVWAADPQMKELTELRAKVVYMSSRECGTGRGQKCDAISQEVKIADQRIAARQGELDAMGKRIAALIPGIEPAQASMFQPMLLPVSLFLMGSFLVAFGVNGKRIEPKFRVQLTGRDALVEQARQFAREFQSTYKRQPKAMDVSKALSVSDFVARGLIRDIAAAA